ncbi:hypothetical protein [Kitasatospora sp. NPDC057198]|uniref:hypothetical protein n=1 Tax=Kitasatospora sp. NPDC057198 TaxID=3346046 RepID=UPI003625E09B
MNDTEHQEMSRALRDLVDSQDPAGPAPVAELLHRGRRRRGLRTTAVTGSVAAVAAIAVFGGIALSGGSAETAVGPAGQGTASASVSVSASASATSGSAAKQGPTTGAEVAALLKSRFPAGYQAVGEPFLVNPRTDEPSFAVNPDLPEETRKQLTKSLRGNDSIGAGYTIANGSKTGTVQITISHGTAGRAPAGCTVPYCSVIKQPDGSILLLTLPSYGPEVPQVWQALLYRTDGTMVTAESGTLPLPGHGQELYAGPPALDGQMLTALALDPVWTQGAAH